MRYKALVTFVGQVAMVKGEVREIPERFAEDLLNAKYVEQVKAEEKPKTATKADPPKPKTTKKKTTKKKAVKKEDDQVDQASE